MKRSMQEMLHTIEAECKYTYGLTGVRQINPAVMEAMAAVPRDKFVPGDMRSYAYDNGPLPIGHGQTISQPYIVALMTHLLSPERDDVILEVGAGSGYQAAVLAKLVQQVYSIEIIPALAEEAKQRLKKLGYTNVEVQQGDGYYGLEKYGPFDGIIVTAAASHIPRPLKDQLKPGARLVIPVGLPHTTQHLMLVEKDVTGSIHVSDVLAVAFVPLTGGIERDI
jgi:protein-L-isoaspartate(D-aspartate) O-methyltransferase